MINNNLPKGYKQSKVGVIPHGWERHELKNLIEISKNTFNPKISNENKKCIELEHISQETGQLLGFTNSSEQQSVKNIFKKNQVLFGKLRPYLRKFWKAQFDGVCSSEIWTINGIKLTNDYLFQFIQTSKFNKIANKSSGSKMPRADWKYMSEIPFNVPLIKEQQKIAKILTTWDNAIEQQQALIDKKQQLKKGLMQQLLTGKTRFPGFTEVWEEYALNELLKERKIYKSKGLELEHVSLTKEGVVPKSKRYERDFLVKEEDKQYKITYLNDICYNPANLKFGVICKNSYKDGIFSPIYVTFEHKNKSDINFLEYFLTWEDFINKVRKYEEGTVFERMAVNPKDFLLFKIKLPSPPERQKIAKILSNADKEIELLNDELNKLKQQKKALMQKLLTGKVRVKL